MTGVNLSQSMAAQAEKRKKHLFSASGFPITIILLILILVGWGGLRFYLYSLDKKITALDATITDSESKFQGESIDRIADFDTRVSLLGADPSELIDPETFLIKLESLIVPQVLLTSYEYDDREKVCTVSGRTDNFRYLAEQIISLKSDPFFSDVKIDAISRNTEGKIEFTLKTNF